MTIWKTLEIIEKTTWKHRDYWEITSNWNITNYWEIINIIHLAQAYNNNNNKNFTTKYTFKGMQ